MTGVTIKRKKYGCTIREHYKGNVLYFTFPALDRIPEVIHGFSSRYGGVSEEHLYSMNLSFSRGDKDENVYENYRRIASAIGFNPEVIVCSDQTHTINIREVTSADIGKGYSREKDYTDVDGLITNVPGIVLATFYADCVPLYFVDPEHHAIALSHSGWRGTVNDIAGETVKQMHLKYGTDPSKLIIAIGPSICQDCYEVSEDVIEQFREHYPREVWEQLFYSKSNGKYQLNLWDACKYNLMKAGVLEKNIDITDICTCCNSSVLYSHRASKGKRGNLAAFLGIR